MAKTVSEYYDLLIAEKQSLTSLTDLLPISGPTVPPNQTLLSDLTTTSKVSHWRLMVWLMAFALYIHETIIEQLAATTESGTPLWYRKKALAFQHGDALEIVNNTPQYPTINPANQIVKLAALVINSEGLLTFKVSKLNGDDPTPLEDDELDAFIAYIDQIKFAGTLTDFVSQPADVLKVSYQIIYDPLIMLPGGNLISATSEFPVEDAIKYFLKNLPYNGFLYLDKLDDCVQAAKGVVHAKRISAHARKWFEGPGGYVNIETLPFYRYNPEAGYLSLSEGSEISTFNYVPES